MAAILAIYYR